MWRLARLRLGLPLRLALPGLKGLELEIGDDAWICVDPALGDLPVLAWAAFDTASRDALDRPVACELRYYHVAASMVRARVLEIMEEALAARLDAARADDD
ncbi:MAG TPA: hypothetical protein VLW45_03780 [Pelomicrobium sp.]|nr:hypothetical protein [Pelomicrobium sp.]